MKRSFQSPLTHSSQQHEGRSRASRSPGLHGMGQSWLWWVGLCTAGVLLAAGCPDKRPEEELTIVVREDTRRIDEKKQQLEAERLRIFEDQKKLDESLQKLKDGFGDQTDDKSREFVDVIKRLQAENSRLSKRLGEEMVQHSSLLDQQKQQATGGGRVSSRGGESSGEWKAEISEVKQQQDALSRDLASVRVSLGGIDAQLRAVLAKLDNLPAGSAPMVAAPVISSGKVVSKKALDRANKKLSSSMSRKGILVMDLPEAYRNHPRDIRKALNSGDNAMAYELISQQQSVVDGIAIDSAFIQAKMVRVNSLVGGSRLSDEKKAAAADKLKDATSAFSDGKYKQANLLINEIVGLMGSS
ncbi:MAG: hypothetical protein ABIJ09_04155 [Pseudomonadota bacterium]